MGNWAKDLKDSNFDFLRIVWPQIKTYCGEGEIIPVEIIKDNIIAKQLDVLAGIDIWQVVTDSGVRGIASRVQWGPTDWGTFTVRLNRFSGAETEFKKRSAAINSNEWIYPYFTCQAYVSQKRVGYLISCAVAKTVDIFNAIDNGYGGIRQTDNASFIYVHWDKVKNVFISRCKRPAIETIAKVQTPIF